MPDDTPRTWHYGLVARWWAEVNTAEPDELAYYGAAIGRFGEPALDLGCGAGRLLVPLLTAGRDVDGVDISPDMLAMARAVGARAGLDIGPRLHVGAFHELALSRRYRTVYCCDSFGIGGSREWDATALARVLAHLEPGGAFVFSHDVAVPVPAGGPGAPRAAEPEPWPEAGRRGRLADGTELEVATRVVTRAQDRETLEIRVRHFAATELLGEETGRLDTMVYTADELTALALDAGFAGVTIEGRYTGAPARPGDPTVVVIARRGH